MSYFIKLYVAICILFVNGVSISVIFITLLNCLFQVHFHFDTDLDCVSNAVTLLRVLSALCCF